MKYMHIPKTAGTALKNAFITNGAQPFTIWSTHDEQIQHGDDWIIVIRDPWKRFCSAYWERRTNPMREKLNARADSVFRRSGYKQLSPAEKQLFTDCDTPQALLHRIQSDLVWWNTFLRENKIMFELFRPYCWYLGELPQFKQQEHRIKMAIDQPCLTEVMRNHFDITMPTEPFLARNRKQFTMPQSYYWTESDQQYFQNQLYAQDYELLAYIKQQPYYITK